MPYRPSIAERIAWTSGHLQSAEAKVLVALWSCGDYETGHNCRPYVNTIVARSGLSRATVTRTLARLRDTHRPGGPWIRPTARRHRQATTYDICVERLATGPPKEQQVSISTVLPSPAVEAHHAPHALKLEAHNEPQAGLEAQNEPQPPGLEAQNEPPTSDPDLYLQERTHTPRVREDAANLEAQNEPQDRAIGHLPILGRAAPPRCQHPHAHAWCEGRVHVPRDLHFEFLDRLGTQPGESAAAKAGRLIAFYAADQARLPDRQSIGDPYTYWKSAFKAWVAEPIPAAAAPERPYDYVWQQIRERLETKVNRYTFHTWFLPLVMVTDTGAVIEVTQRGPDSGRVAAWIQKHYSGVVQAAVDEVRPGTRVEVIDVWAIERAQYGQQRPSAG